MAFFATATAPTDALDSALLISSSPVIVPTYVPISSKDQEFIAVEIDCFRPGDTEITLAVATASMPSGAVSLEPYSNESYEVLYASDSGYITKNGDLPMQVLYAPTLNTGWAVDRVCRLEPWANSGAVSWGSIKLIRMDGRYDGISESSSPEGRRIKILRGVKTFDASRGILVNPSYSTLQSVFCGVGNGLWRNNENDLEINIRDASYQGEVPIQTSIYAGTGGYNGTADIKGRPLPFCRGGSASYPIQNISPILIDPTNRIWQYNDSPGTVVNLYERGATVFTYAGDTTNLYSGSTAAGQYRTDNSRGLFQLGSTAQGEITADVTGSFPVGGLQNTAVNIARYILTETLSIDSNFIDLGNLIGLNSARPWIAGIYITEPVIGMEVVDLCLKSINAWLSPSKSGKLRAVRLQAPGTLNISASYTQNQIIRCTPRVMPELLSPPPYRIRLAHSRRYTTQNTNWAGAATDARKQFVAEEWSYATWVGTDTVTRYRKQNDPPPVETILLVASEAQQVVDELGEIFGTKRSLFDLELPMYLAPRHEIGEEISVGFTGQISSDSRALILGDSINSTSPTFTQTVLI